MLLLHYGDDPVTTQDLAVWFNFYNARQMIEAGNKEGKGTFAMRYLKVRSRPGLYLQEQFGRFAANFVRFASQWMVEQCPQLPSGWKDLEKPKVKQQVQVGAHTSAKISWLEQGCLLRFTDHSVFAGRSLSIGKPVAIQLALRLPKKFKLEVLKRFADHLHKTYATVSEIPNALNKCIENLLLCLDGIKEFEHG